MAPSRTNLRYILCLLPFIAWIILVRTEILHGVVTIIGLGTAFIIAGVIFYWLRNMGALLRIQVKTGSAWKTHDLKKGRPSITIEPGYYAGRRVKIRKTGRTAIVLCYPRIFGLDRHALIGDDEEQLRAAIKAGKVNVVLDG